VDATERRYFLAVKDVEIIWGSWFRASALVRGTISNFKKAKKGLAAVGTVRDQLAV
jgi:hypothetical protein